MAIEWLKKFAKGPTTSQPANDWRSEIGKADLTRQEFCSLCVDASRDLFKDATIEHGDSMEEILVRRDSGTPITIFLSNLWSKIRSLQGGRAEEIERFLGAMVKAADASPAANRDAMVPMIKDVAYLKEILANFTEDDKQTVTEHLAGDLWIVYAFDTPETIVTMQKKHLRELKVKTQELRPLAVENLRRLLPPIMLHGDGPLFMLTAGADYVASLMLFDDVWAEIQERIEGDIVAAVPSRDTLLFTDSTSQAGIKELRSSITRVTQSGGYLVSSTMFRRTTEGWKPFS
jgi:uncharacterized protein YtpQ (UPF0354 family)